MKIVFLNIIFLLFLNSFSKTTHFDTIATLLKGQGCGITPNTDEVVYNINLLENIQKTDSNNVLIYKHLAMQYYYSWSREKDELLREKYRQKSINNNIKVLDLHQFKKVSKSGTIINLMILYSRANDCLNTKKYYALLKKKEIKSIDNGTIEYIKLSCNIE